MKKLDAIEQAKYLQKIADEALAISSRFNEDMGKVFGKRGVVYFLADKKRVYYTIIRCVYSPVEESFLYDIEPINPPAHVYPRNRVREDELKIYPYKLENDEREK